MKRLIAVLALMLAASPAMARKSCEELKAEIDAKIKAKGIKEYSLTIVEQDQTAEGKVVGTCDGGTRKIVYRRG